MPDRHCSEAFTCINLLNFYDNIPHPFTDVETEAQRLSHLSMVTMAKKWQNWDMNPENVAPELLISFVFLIVILK